VIEINCSRSLGKSKDLLKNRSLDGTNYLASPIHPSIHGIKLQKMYLLWKMLNGGSESSPLSGENGTDDSMERGGADLMMQLLRLDPIKRLTANDALDHPWFWTTPRPAKCAE
jgi:serine/threonine protein kinase